jgi:inorganic pyrophosphatase
MLTFEHLRSLVELPLVFSKFKVKRGRKTYVTTAPLMRRVLGRLTTNRRIALVSTAVVGSGFLSSSTIFSSSSPALSSDSSKSRENEVDRMLSLMGLLFKPHPWHGLTLGSKAPETVIAYIECVPGENIKYEVDKATGYIVVDRPHKFSSLCPTIYGFLPQTYCGESVAARCMERTGLSNIKGDSDPIDICILSTRNINRGDVILRVRPIGGLRMIDGGEADDKIIAVIEGDPVMSAWQNICDVPKAQLDLIRHYFLTYKQGPDTSVRTVSVPEVYDRQEAYEMIRRSSNDYKATHANVKYEFAAAILAGIKRELAHSLLDGPGRS